LAAQPRARPPLPLCKSVARRDTHTTTTQFANPSPAASSTPPVIILAGENPAHLNVGDTYQDLGATAKDSAGHDLTVRTLLNGALVSSIVLGTTEVATDTIDYVASDQNGLTSTSTRTVIITAPLTTEQTTLPPSTASTATSTSTAQ
jgi:hypothetical protein